MSSSTGCDICCQINGRNKTQTHLFNVAVFYHAYFDLSTAHDKVRFKKKLGLLGLPRRGIGTRHPVELVQTYAVTRSFVLWPSCLAATSDPRACTHMHALVKSRERYRSGRHYRFKTHLALPGPFVARSYPQQQQLILRCLTRH